LDKSGKYYTDQYKKQREIYGFENLCKQIFNERVTKSLLDENRVHRYHYKLVGNIYYHILRRITLFEFQNYRIDKLLKNRRGFDQLDISAVDTGYRKQILYHTDKPFGILLDTANHLSFLNIGQAFIIS